MSANVDVPGVGPVNKRVVIGLSVGLVAFIGWRYYAASSVSSAGDEESAGDSGYEDGGTIPAVAGATDWYGSGGGSGGGSGTAPDGTSTQILTNQQWSAYARDQLLAVDAYNGQAISEALGNYLSGAPLSKEQQQIVRAAIGYAGYPPVGTHVLIPGGDATVTTAPTGLRQTGVSQTSVNLSWDPMDGVSSFAVYRTDVSVPTSVSRTGTTATVGGLTPNTSYTFQVAALSSSGQPGPKSAAVTTKTAAWNLTAPPTPSISGVKATSVVAKTSRVTGADGYEWFRNGALVGHTDDPTFTYTGLKPRTKYTLQVRADNRSQPAGALSGRRIFTTKAK